MAEPLGVAFVEIEPVAAGFRAKTEAQLRTQLAGVSAGIPPSPATAAATKQVEGHAIASNAAAAAHQREAAALVDKTVAASGAAVAEGRAAVATAAHGTAARTATGHILAESAAMSGLRNIPLGGMSAPLIAAAAAATILFKSLEEADQFNEQLHLIEAATHATAEEMDHARATAIGFGHDLNIPLTSATDAATAINLLTRSGFDLDDALTATRGALLLTAASGDTLETSVKEVDRILDAFNLTAADSVRVADAIASGLKFTQGNAAEFAQALGTLAPAADSLGLSLEATNTLVLQLSESGLSATQASGSLRQAFLKLAAGGKGVDEGLASIGLNMSDLRDELGRLRPDAFVILAEALQGLNRETQLQILTQIFSRRAALGVIRIVEQQRDGYERMAEVARESGTAQEEAAAKTQSFGGTLKETKKDAADFGRQVGSVATGPATAYVGMLGDILRGADDATFALGALAGGIGDVGGALGDAIPFADRFGDVIKKGIVLQAFPVLGIAKGISSIVGHFRKGGEDIDDILDAMNKGVAADLDELAAILRAKAGAIASGANDVGQSLATQLAVAEATGTEAEQLRILRQIKADALTRLRRNQERLKKGEVGNAAVQDAAADVKAADDAIDAILAGQAADSAASAAEAEANATKIEQAADKRDRAFIRAQQARVARRQERVSVAAETDPLGDDIKANIKLRRLLVTIIAETQARIREARAAGRSTEALASELSQLRTARRAVEREIKGLQREAKEQAAETRVEQAQLDLQIAEARIGDDPTARQANRLIQGHLKVIAALKKQQRLTKRRSVEWKQLQLAIEEERQAIRQLRKDTSAAGQESNFAAQAFAFLGTQQGFFANTASNVFPGGTAGRGVGGSRGAPGQHPVTTAAGVGSPFRSRSQVAEAEAERKTGMTQAQAATLIQSTIGCTMAVTLVPVGEAPRSDGGKIQRVTDLR